jgi:hypothetical protein
MRCRQGTYAEADAKPNNTCRGCIRAAVRASRGVFMSDPKVRPPELLSFFDELLNQLET